MSEVTPDPIWFDVKASRTVLEISYSIPEGLPQSKCALFVFDFAEPVSADDLSGSGIWLSSTVGPFVYIEGEQGQKHFSTSVKLPHQTLRRVGLRLWEYAATLTVTDVKFLVRQPESFLVNMSFDVEALPHRAAGAHMDTLVFGRANGQEHGIASQMDVLENANVPATFYLEVGQIALYGVRPVRAAAEAILNRGFDLQLHLHAELLEALERWPRHTNRLFPGLEDLNRLETRRAMLFAVSQFIEITGKRPRVFRAGSFRYNPFTLIEGHRLGIEAFSNYRTDYHSDNCFEFADQMQKPFRWSNGIFELPITISPEPLSSLNPEVVWSRILSAVDIKGAQLVTIVLHSWSFLRRNQAGHHEWEDDTLRDAFESILHSAPSRAKFVTACEMVDLLASGRIAAPDVRSPNELVRASQHQVA